MISFRKADLIDRFRKTTHEVVMDFHYDKNESEYFLYIYDPSGDSMYMQADLDGMFRVAIMNMQFDINKLIFNGCQGEFNESDMETVHELIEDYTAKLQELGRQVRVKEDHVYKRPDEGSRYLVFMEVS